MNERIRDAAPDLLAALKRTAPVRPTNHHLGCGCCACEVYAAIAKAEGTDQQPEATLPEHKEAPKSSEGGAL